MKRFVKRVMLMVWVALAATHAHAQTISSIITANGGTVTLSNANLRAGVGIQVTDTWVGTIQFEGSVDGTNFAALPAVPLSTQTLVSSATANGIWTVPIAGLHSLRVRASAWTSGSARVTLRATDGSPAVGGVPPLAVTLDEPIDVSLIASSATGLQPTVLASGAALSAGVAHTSLANSSLLFKLISAATTNSTNVKATAGSLYGWTITNVSTAARYVKLYDLAVAPTCGTSVPIATIAMPSAMSGTITGGGEMSEQTFGVPVGFANGIGLCITALAADSDATAIVAGDVVVNLVFK